MELKLNIYDENDEVIKTYTKDSYKIKMRFIHRFIKDIDFDSLAKSLESKEDDQESTVDLISSVASLVTNSYDTIKDLLKDVFKDLTDEEYLDTNLDEVVLVLINLVKYTVQTIGLAGAGGKN